LRLLPLPKASGAPELRVLTADAEWGCRYACGGCFCCGCCSSCRLRLRAVERSLAIHCLSQLRGAGAVQPVEAQAVAPLTRVDARHDAAAAEETAPAAKKTHTRWPLSPTAEESRDERRAAEGVEWAKGKEPGGAAFCCGAAEKGKGERRYRRSLLSLVMYVC